MVIVPLTLNQDASPPFQTTIVLDGQSYSLVVTWNMAGQRYYYEITNENGTLIIAAPLIGSPQNFDILLAPGMFSTSTIVFREQVNQFEIGP